MPHFHSYHHVPVRLLLLIVFLAFFFVFILQTLIDKTATTAVVSQWTHPYFFYHLSNLGLQGVLEPQQSQQSQGKTLTGHHSEWTRVKANLVFDGRMLTSHPFL